MTYSHRSLRNDKKYTNQLRTVELFAGIGGFRIAAEKRGIKTVWANDINSIACSVYKDQFGEDSIKEGDIWKLIKSIPKHDLLTGGFPCQPFSSAGKKKGISDPRGTLFQAIIEVLKLNQPKFFILENVKRLLSMDKGLPFATILSALAELDYRIEWRVLNAMHFGLPQNRQRVVLSGIHLSEYKNKESEWNSIESIKLADPNDFSKNNKILKNFIDIDEWKNIEDHGSSFPNWGVACKGKFFSSDLVDFHKKTKLVTLNNVLEEDAPKFFDLTESTIHRLGSNSIVRKYVGGVEIISNQRGGARMGYTIFGINGLAPTLTSSTSRHYERYKIENNYRRLTNIEYARIQGFPDNHCSIAPLRHQYVLYGNAVPPALVGWVMDRILDTKLISFDIEYQPLKLFTNAF